MKKLLLLAISFISLSTYAQTYFPIPDSAIVWRQYGYVQGFNCCCTGPGPCLRDDDFQYFLRGDTVVGAQLYNKVYKTGKGNTYIAGMYTCPPWCGNFQYSYYSNTYEGGIRNDVGQKKVYYLPPNATQDTLLYDFDLKLGDTLSPSWLSFGNPVYVTGVDSILVGGLYHKRFDLSASSFPNEVTIIEGIGGSLGLLSPLFTNVNVSNISNTLLCVTVNQIPVYPDTATVCAFVSINSASNSILDYKVLPNPFSNKLNVILNKPGTVRFILYDVTSKEIINEELSNSAIIPTEQFSKGIYFYEIRNEEGVLSKGKVVKK